MRSPSNTYGYSYKGWEIYDNGPEYWPVTGRYQAKKFGIRIGTSTEEGLIKMIDQRPMWTSD
jgi:hypothetical protein